TRPATGFCGAGCGAIDFAATVMSLYRNTVPPTPNTDALAETCRFSFVQRDPLDAKIRAAVTLGYSLAGGQTAALVVKRFEE
ncbi:MAG: ketosynthase chain-length factor, partial [Planctomycetes bacterium]|nr:ketosynthase chain-length factor [Planctomycetota bacterium]